MKVNMKQLEKDFKKLKQLDRIEFRQRENIIRKSSFFDKTAILVIALTIFITSSIAFAIAFLGAPYYGDAWFIQFYRLFGLLWRAAYGVFIFGAICVAVNKYIITKRLRKLVKEYCPKAIVEKKK